MEYLQASVGGLVYGFDVGRLNREVLELEGPTCLVQNGLTILTVQLRNIRNLLSIFSRRAEPIHIITDKYNNYSHNYSFMKMRIRCCHFQFSEAECQYLCPAVKMNWLRRPEQPFAYHLFFLHENISTIYLEQQLITSR